MIDSSRLEDLILARLSVRTKKAPPRSKVSEDLFRFVSSRLSASEWRDVFEQALERLAQHGLVTERPLGVTETGRVRLAKAMGTRKPHEFRKWSDLKREALPILIGQGDASAESLVARELGVKADGLSSSRIADTWLAKKLELGNRKVTWGSVKTSLVARELGVPLRPKLEDVMRLAAAKAAGAKSGRTEDIVTALTHRWLEGESTRSSVEPAGDAAEAESANIDPTRLLGKVRAAAKGPAAKRFGSSKVFISSVWEALRADRELREIGEEGFKQLLVDAHRRGDIVLARADLVTAMDPKDVLASETRHLNSVYHFIQIGDRA